MSEQNIAESAPVEKVVKPLVDAAAVPAKVEKSLGEKFVELVKLLKEHGIHYKS